LKFDFLFEPLIFAWAVAIRQAGATRASVHRYFLFRGCWQWTIYRMLELEIFSS